MSFTKERLRNAVVGALFVWSKPECHRVYNDLVLLQSIFGVVAPIGQADLPVSKLLAVGPVRLLLRSSVSNHIFRAPTDTTM